MSGHVEDTILNLKLMRRSRDLYTTIGINPMRALEPYSHHISKTCNDPAEFLEPGQRKELIKAYFKRVENQLDSTSPDRIVAIGSCGLDFDRENHSSRSAQIEAFKPHFKVAEKYGLPMYFVCRGPSFKQFVDIIRQNRHRFSTGVIHGFTGNTHQLQVLISLELFISINACSLRNEVGCKMVKAAPLDRLMIETDSPFCYMKDSHYCNKYVKTDIPCKGKRSYNPVGQGFMTVVSRNEPCMIV